VENVPFPLSPLTSQITEISQDITLFSTTLRFGATNEVATVSNGSIASARITNCARSKNAAVHILLKLHIKMHEGRNVDLFREALENFVLDHPNIWDSIVLFRCEEIDADNEFVVYRLVVRSRQSWQVRDRQTDRLGDVMKVCYCMLASEMCLICLLSFFVGCTFT
jgi:small-conductance mechanosensitive channel